MVSAISLVLLGACISVSILPSILASVPTGGESEIDVDDDIRAMAWRAVDKALNSQSNSLFYMVPVSVDKASVQVVQGALYHIYVTTAYSTCSKAQVAAKDVSAENCSPNLAANGKAEYCHLTVWSRPWLKDGDAEIVEKIRCSKSPILAGTDEKQKPKQKQ